MVDRQDVIELITTMKLVIPVKIEKIFPEGDENPKSKTSQRARQKRQAGIDVWTKMLSPIEHSGFLTGALDELMPRFSKLYPSDEVLPMIREKALEIQATHRKDHAVAEANRRHEERCREEDASRMIPGYRVNPDDLSNEEVIANLESFQVLMDGWQGKAEELPIREWIRSRLKGRRGNYREMTPPPRGQWPRPCFICSQYEAVDFLDMAMHHAEHWPEKVALTMISGGWPRGAERFARIWDARAA